MARMAPGMSEMVGGVDDWLKVGASEALATQTLPVAGSATPMRPPPSSMDDEPDDVFGGMRVVRATSICV